MGRSSDSRGEKSGNEPHLEATMSPAQKQAVEQFQGILRGRFPDVASNLRAEEQFGSVVVHLGVSGARLSDIEAAMTGPITDIMMSSGILLMLVS